MSEENRPTTAVLLMGFGGPDCLDAVEPFMCNLMGREPSAELLEDVKRRYLVVGGESPLLKYASAIADGVEAKLAEKGTPAPVAIGMRYWDPFISDTLRGMYAWGIRRVVTVSLSPFSSAVSTGAYRAVLDEIADELPDLEIVEAPLLYTLDAFKGLIVMGVVEALTELKDYKPILTVFTAHSLPLSDIADDDSYVHQIREIVDGVVETLALPVGDDLNGSDPKLKGIVGYGNLRDPQPWVFAYQSKGNRPGEWLGPDIDEVVDAAIVGDFKSIAAEPHRKLAHQTEGRVIPIGRERSQGLARAVVWGSALTTLILLFLIVAHIVTEGLPHITTEFLLGLPRRMGREGGILPAIVGTLALSGLAIAIATPLGVGTAIYLTEYTREGRVTRLIRFGTESLAGVPSIIFGLFGFVFFVITLGLGWSILSGGLTLAAMILPTIIRTSEEAIRSVPRVYRDVSFCLGATRWQTVTRAVLPSALPGIATGIILGIGRSVGETAAVILTAGSAFRMPSSVFSPTRTMAVHFYILAREGISLEMAYATGTVLVVTVLTINVVANALLRRMVAQSR